MACSRLTPMSITMLRMTNTVQTLNPIACTYFVKVNRIVVQKIIRPTAEFSKQREAAPGPGR